jgi:hypothetical protein
VPAYLRRLLSALESGDVERAMQTLRIFFADIPYDSHSEVTVREARKKRSWYVDPSPYHDLYPETGRPDGYPALPVSCTCVIGGRAAAAGADLFFFRGSPTACVS